MNRQFRTSTESRGFTLVEMIITLIILAIILSLAAPSFRGASASSAIKSSTMDLIASINNSRAQAVNLGSVAKLEASDGSSWSKGWKMSMASPHDDQNQSFNAASDVTIETTGGETSVEFRRDGTTSAQLTFRICHDGASGETGREITINRLGRTTNKEHTCT